MRLLLALLLACGCSGSVDEREEPARRTPPSVVRASATEPADAGEPEGAVSATVAPEASAPVPLAPAPAWVAKCDDDGTEGERVCLDTKCIDCLKTAPDASPCSTQCDRTVEACLLDYGLCVFSCDTAAGKAHCADIGGTCGEDRADWCGPN